MKITHLTIHNYRSVQHVELEVPEMLVLLGPNNHGKSNILTPLELLFRRLQSQHQLTSAPFVIRETQAFGWR